jgi:YggT family protein
MASVQSWLYKMTEPVLAPIRRALPSMGGLDLSPMLLLIALQILGNALA